MHERTDEIRRRIGESHRLMADAQSILDEEMRLLAVVEGIEVELQRINQPPSETVIVTGDSDCGNDVLQRLIQMRDAVQEELEQQQLSVEVLTEEVATLDSEIAAASVQS